MEHKLILGGEQYLPFARSRIKALRAAGLNFGSQQFSIDGAEIQVRIDGEHSYIRINGFCEVALDSGIVPIVGGDANLYETAYAKRYNTPFVKKSPLAKVRISESQGSAGQISGTVDVGNTIKGKVPVDGSASKSFSADHQEQRAIKEAFASICPPSIFTGRCRLWIQSIYGQPIKSDKDTFALRSVVSETSAAPALMVKSYEASNNVMVSTSSGVVLDKAGRHWLFNFVNSDTIRVYSLRASKCAEKLRKYLAANDAGAYPENLSPEDREHIEAYVLSASLPVVQSLQTIGLGASVSQYSMGYGWHWKFSGAVADIVTSETYMHDALSGAMRSTHYRVELVESGGTWSAITTVIEGPKNWSVNRSYWCVAEPNFPSRSLLKTTPNKGAQLECDAPIYAFYKRDDLQVARIIVRKTSASSSRSMTDQFSTDPNYGGDNSSYTSLGMLPGWLEDKSTSEAYELTVRVGDYSVADLPRLKTQQIKRSDVTDKIWDGTYALGFFSDPGQWKNQSFPTGYPLADGSYTMSPATDGDLVKTGWQGKVTYKLNHTDTSEETTGIAAVVIPLYDSEAVFCWSQKVSTKTGTERTGTWGAGYIGGSFIVMNGVGKTGQPWIEWDHYVYQSAGGGNFQQVIVPETTSLVSATNSFTDQKLVCRAGTLDASFATMQEFFDNTKDEIEQPFSTWSGVQTGENAVVLSRNATAFGFEATTNINIPAIVGWA